MRLKITPLNTFLTAIFIACLMIFGVAQSAEIYSETVAYQGAQPLALDSLEIATDTTTNIGKTTEDIDARKNKPADPSDRLVLERFTITIKPDDNRPPVYILVNGDMRKLVILEIVQDNKNYKKADFLWL